MSSPHPTVFLKDYFSKELKQFAHDYHMTRNHEYIETLCKKSIKLTPGHIIALTIGKLTESYLPICGIDDNFQYLYLGSYGKPIKDLISSPGSYNGVKLAQAEGLIQMCHIRVPTLDYVYDHPSTYTLASLEYVFNTEPNHHIPLDLLEAEYNKLNLSFKRESYNNQYESLKNRVGSTLLTEEHKQWSNSYQYRQLMNILKNDPQYSSYYTHIASVEEEFLANGHTWLTHLETIKKRRDEREKEN